MHKSLTADRKRRLLEKLEAMTGLVDATIQSVQKMATDLRPIVLDTLGLSASIEWQLNDFQRQGDFECKLNFPEEDIALPKDCSTAVFRIFQESLTNIARHSAATKIEVSLHQKASNLILTVRDNGCGFQPDTKRGMESLGLLGMRERALALNGKCEITSQPGKGTLVEVCIPLSPFLAMDGNQ